MVWATPFPGIIVILGRETFSFSCLGMLWFTLWREGHGTDAHTLRTARNLSQYRARHDLDVMRVGKEIEGAHLLDSIALRRQQLEVAHQGRGIARHVNH